MAPGATGDDGNNSTAYSYFQRSFISIILSDSQNNPRRVAQLSLLYRHGGWDERAQGPCKEVTEIAQRYNSNGDDSVDSDDAG